MTITEKEFRLAAIAACRVVWTEVYGGSWDADCPAKERWISEEGDALRPALRVLGIGIEEDA